MKKTLIILNIAGLFGSLIWLMNDKTWEPLVTSLGLISSLIVLIFTGGQGGNNITMNQKGGKGSTNYQSQGDINIK